MRITKIANDNAGYKLISAEFIQSIKGHKPISLSHTFFDYKNGILREFHGHSVNETTVSSFKEALRLVLSMGCGSYNMSFNVLNKYGSDFKVRANLVK